VPADASVVPLYLYAVFGTSRQLAVGPVALVSLLVEAGLRWVGVCHPASLSVSPSELLASPSELSVSPSELLASPSELSASPIKL
jgi:hypothetical protein